MKTMTAEEALALANQYTDTHGGGGGTRDYSQLTHKPSINDVELSGNKTASDLGLMPAYEVDTTPTESSENLITSGGVWNSDKNINNKLQGSKTAGSTDGSPFEIPDYGMTESIDMYFKPTQDLHGYDKPWAGGAGKNKCPAYTSTETQYGVTIAGNSEGEISVNGMLDGANLYGFVLNGSISLGAGTYTLNGANPNGARLVLYDSNDNVLADSEGTTTFTLESTTTTVLRMYVYANVQYDEVVRPMIRLSTETDADFEPYANICPIGGQDSATFEWTDSHDDDWELQMNFGKTCYGGFCQFNGQVYSQWSYIASYNGETLSGEWVSDRDEYVAGTTPTIGAEVAYYDSQSTDYFRVTPPANLNLTDDYPIEYNGYMANISYQPKNTVLAEAKRYTNQKLLSAGLPTPPTTDGTYHLECSVSGGIPTIRWVSNS